MKFGQVLNSVRGLIWLVSTLIPLVWTFLAGLAEGLPWSQLVVFATLALAGGAMFAYFILRGYEIVSGWYGIRQEAARLAAQFSDLVNVGQKEIRISHAAELWAGREANAYQKLVCLRRLKQAADAGLIAFHPSVNGKASKDSMAALADVATLFRERQWTTLPPLPPQNAPPMKAVERTARRNWVTGWRR